MERKIDIKNLNSPKYRALTSAGGILILIALASWWLEGPDYVAYTAAALGVTAFTVLSMDGFTAANSVSYGGKSVTMKLLGNKTIGFLFKDIQEVNLQEPGLLIRVEGMEAVKLSRKRYTEESLEELTKLLNDKKDK
ncbi:hypothetical protein [Nonlabens antarcticus]|uniref:hypothetical protein n=1 Tax=Nonlabens antarcticus TaxID=392714 RepID=UPI001891B100|nr:hypothetical protein [Nonlabens antarcticus]